MAENVMYQHIVKSPEMLSGRPHIAGRRIRVQDIYQSQLLWGWDPDRICDEYDLSLGQVFAALAYAYDHLDEIRGDIQQDEALYAMQKASTPSLVQQKRADRNDG
ncbi:MAG: DUF433 domain-containing protein [Anaerolineae bacterium]|nr:DUF433 domain-containing protein [Anaerolineae bacterium]